MATHRRTKPRPAPPAVPPTLRLPDYIEPMLARPSQPFDSAAHLFELKWDGTRAVTYVDAQGRYRMLNRRRREIGWRYPELSFVGELPPGTVMDGEIVCFGPDGKPDFQALQAREQVRTELRASRSALSCPATYVVFDLLYDKFVPIMSQRCDARRQRLRELVASAARPRIVMSEGIVGAGTGYFERATAEGLEGVIAKRLDSAYQPGRRTGAWLKIKRHETLACVVIGFVPEGKDDFGSLIVAAQDAAGELRCVGRVGSGFDDMLRERINRYLYRNLRPRPVVPSPDKGLWVEPGLYCTVRCMERTADGRLRAPVFGEVTQCP